MPIEVATVSIFAPFNFAVSLSSRNSRNKGHANIKVFTVYNGHRPNSAVPSEVKTETRKTEPRTDYSQA